MAKAKAKRSTGPAKDAALRPDAQARPRPDLRVAHLSLDAAVRPVLSAELAKLTDRKKLTDAARSLVSGKLAPRAALLSLVQAGSQALDSAAKEAQRAAGRQALVSRALRDDLLRLQAGGAMPRPRKDDYVLRGKVVLASGEPASGLAVEAIDQDVSKHDALGAAVTDDKGAFQIRFPAKSLAEAGEKGPEIVLSIGVEGQAPLHVTEAARLFDSGREASVEIALTESAQAAAAAAQEVDARVRLFRLDYTHAVTQFQQQQFGDVVKELQAGVGKLIEGLQLPSAPAKGAAPRKRTK